jgi:hypothetical protein
MIATATPTTVNILRSLWRKVLRISRIETPVELGGGVASLLFPAELVA